MIKAIGPGRDGRPVMLLGMTWAEVQHMANNAIFLDLAPYGVEAGVLLMVGENERSMMGELDRLGLVGEDTKRTRRAQDGSIHPW